MKDFELRLYDDQSPDYYENLEEIVNIKNDTKISKKPRFKNYGGVTPAISGLFFSGVGYTVGSVGSLIKDIATYACSEIPKIPSYISNGTGYDAFHNFYTFLGESLLRANHYGGIGAVVGLIGGSILIVKMKNSVASVIDSFLSK